jgi:hypothetical protein
MDPEESNWNKRHDFQCAPPPPGKYIRKIFLLIPET